MSICQNNKFLFDKKITTAIKGIAIIIMLWHHFFGFPNWLNSDISFFGISFINGKTLEIFLGEFGKVCISIYSLISGYGLYISFSSKKNIWDYKYVIKKVIFIFINWWLIFFMFNLPASYFSGYTEITLNMVIKAMFFLDPIINPFVSYMQFYVIALFVFPIFVYIIKRTKFDAVLALALPFFSIAVRYVLARLGLNGSTIYMFFLYLPYLLMGCFACKNKWFDKLYVYYQKLGKLKGVILALLIISVIFVRQFSGKGLQFDAYFSFVLVFSLACILQKTARKTDSVPIKILSFFGKNSANIWFIHSTLIFSFPILQKILYFPYLPILILLWGFAICIPFSVLIGVVMKHFKRVL